MNTIQVRSILQADFKIKDLDIFIGDHKLSEEERRKFLATNKVIGYRGAEIALSTWARSQARGLSPYNLPGEAIEDKRLALWDSHLKKELDPVLLELINLAKKGEVITLWYISKAYDKPTAMLIKRFVEWSVV